MRTNPVKPGNANPYSYQVSQDGDRFQAKGMTIDVKHYGSGYMVNIHGHLNSPEINLDLLQVCAIINSFE